MSVFDFQNYKRFVLSSIENMPKKGRGQMSKLAQFINTTPVIVSQVFKGDRELTIEQAFDAADFFGLNEMEKEYFMLMVQHTRAGHHRLKKHYQTKLNDIKIKSKNLNNRLTDSKKISPEAKARFYSNWHYAAISLLITLEGKHTPDSIAEYFNLPLMIVREALHFMHENGMVVEKKGEYYTGPQHTHLSKDSPYINNHHRNWRVKATERLDNLTEDETLLTFPMSLSKKDAETIQNKLLKLVEEVDEIASSSKEEILYCLNFDWFKYWSISLI